MNSTPDIGSSTPIPIASSSGLPIAMVNAYPRNGTPRTDPIISAECALSIGSKKIRCRSPATFDRSDAPTPAINKASRLTMNSLLLLYPA